MLKRKLIDLAIWFLRKQKKSVIIGYNLTGGIVKCQYADSYVYDLETNGIKYLLKDGTPFEIPCNEEFKMSYQERRSHE